MIRAGHQRQVQVRFALAAGVMLTVSFAWVLSTAVASAQSAASPAAIATSPIPVLAYYYIWYTPGSWDRAKSDLPSLGAYSSDDVTVMRQHIEWAKQAGISGFIVSWKNTYTLSRRLDQLVEVARSENFKLAIEYEGLDFDRSPLPISQVASDLDYFTAHWGADPVFSIFDKPLVIWSGTWEFSAAEIQSVTASRRDKLLILASERNVADYQRLATMVDGDAYYWSSVNPTTFAGYDDKLNAMSSAVHANQGLWIAPAAPGFDGRMIGGTTIVPRNNGQTLTAEYNAAASSNPDAIGLISWNEFSEASYIEPSKAYGQTYLTEVSDLLHASVPPVTNFDSDASSGGNRSLVHSLSQLMVFGTLIFTAAATVVVRAIRRM